MIINNQIIALGARRNVPMVDPRVGRYHSNATSPQSSPPKTMNEKEARLRPHPPASKKDGASSSDSTRFTAVNPNIKLSQFRSISTLNKEPFGKENTPSYSHLRTARSQEQKVALAHSTSSPRSNVSSPKSHASPFHSPKSVSPHDSKKHPASAQSGGAEEKIDTVAPTNLADRRFKELSRANQYHVLNVNTSPIPDVLQYIETMKNRFYHVGEPKYTADPPRRLTLEWKKDILDKLLNKCMPQLHFNVVPTLYRNHNANSELFADKFDLYRTKKTHGGDKFIYEPDLDAETVTARYCQVAATEPPVLTRKEKEAKEREERDKRRREGSPRISNVGRERTEKGAEEKKTDVIKGQRNGNQEARLLKNMSAIVFTKNGVGTDGNFHLMNAKELKDYLNTPVSESSINPEVISDHYNGSHDEENGSFIQILHGCEKPQVLLFSFKHTKRTRHGFDNAVTIERIPFTSAPTDNDHKEQEVDEKEKEREGVKHKVNFEEVDDLNIMNMNIRPSNKNGANVSRVDFDKFSVMAAENGAQLITDMTAFFKSSLFDGTTNDKATEEKSEVPTNFKIIKFKVYFVVDMENFDRMFLHHFDDVHVAGSPHWPPATGLEWDEKSVDQRK